MNSVVYYLPNIPDNQSTTRYNHARAIPEFADSATLITYPSEPPAAVANCYEDVHVLPSDGHLRQILRTNLHVLASDGHLRRALRAKRLADTVLDGTGESGIYLTSFHYVPALSGWLSNHKWVLDVYDDPHQLAYHNTGYFHEIGVRALVRILRRADRAVHTIHPSTPHTFGDQKHFAVNGAAVKHIEPREPTDSSDKLRGVCAGFHGGLDVLLRGVAASEVEIEIDVFGAVSADDRNLTDRLDLQDSLTFHGKREHREVIEAVERADIGFCLLPDTLDWYYAHPIKIGEYLAGGTIPVASAFPGIRQLVRDAGVLVDPKPEAVAAGLNQLATNDRLRNKLARRARQRATEIDWRDEREWFAKQAVLGAECWQAQCDR